jgi:hypothetical protein
MNLKLIALAAAGVTLGTTFAAAPAEARWHGSFVGREGPGGRGYFRTRSVNREPGSVSVNRNFQTNSGRGMTSNRSASWGNGTYNGGATHTLNNGESFGRSTSVTRNGDGTASYTTTHTAIDGDTRTRTGTISR